jgi:uncharacterized membrane protein YoaT (DUF817 family)
MIILNNVRDIVVIPTTIALDILSDAIFTPIDIPIVYDMIIVICIAIQVCIIRATIEQENIWMQML